MPSSFKTKLIVQAPEPGESEWVLMEDFMFYLDEKDMKSETILIRKGYSTDFASIPRPFWAIYPPYDPVYGKAAVLHDGIYNSHIYSRAKADELFRVGMRILGASLFTRNTMYYAVRTFGGIAYKHTPDDLRIARTFVVKIPAPKVTAFQTGELKVGELVDLQLKELVA